MPKFAHGDARSMRLKWDFSQAIFFTLSDMKSSRQKYFWIITPLLLLVVAVVAGLIWRGEYTTEQTAELSFVIEEDFTKIRKIMVRTEAAKEIVTMGGGSEFVEQTWEGGTASAAGQDLGKAILQNVFSTEPDWELKLSGKLKVRTLDEYIGKNVVTLKQDVVIKPDYLQSDTDLQQGSERLLGYAMTTRLEREEEHTRIKLKLTQKIKTDAPWFAHAIADRRVRASAEKTLTNQEAAMRQLITDNRDKNWLFPLR